MPRQPARIQHTDCIHLRTTLNEDELFISKTILTWVNFLTKLSKASDKPYLRHFKQETILDMPCKTILLRPPWNIFLHYSGLQLCQANIIFGKTWTHTNLFMWISITRSLQKLNFRVYTLFDSSLREELVEDINASILYTKRKNYKPINEIYGSIQI